MKVLIVDSEPKRLKSALRALEGAGHAVVGAVTGSEALLSAQETRPDLILLEMALPDISGIDLTKQIKQDPDLAEAYVALISGPETSASIRARGLEGGADAHIVRTSSSRELLARVEALFRRKHETDTVRTSLQEWRACFDAINDPVYLVDLDDRVVRCNQALTEFLGVPVSRIVGRRCYDLIHGTSEPVADCPGERVRETKCRETLVARLQGRWIEICVDPILDADGELIGMVHMLSDVTEQAQVEKALEQAHGDLEALDEERRSALAGMERTLQAEVAVRHQVEDALKQMYAELAGAEDSLRTEAAERRSIEDLLKDMRAELAGRRQAEAELRDNEERLRAAAQSVADVIYEWDIESAQMRFFDDPRGKWHEELKPPETLEELYEAMHPDDRERVRAALDQYLAEPSEEAFSEEYRTVAEDGTVRDWVTCGTVLRDEDGNAQRWIGTATDVTDRKQAEEAEERFAVRKHRAERMEAIALLAGGVAQDLAQLLTVVLGSAELAMGHLRPSYPLYDDLVSIRKAAQKGADLVGELFAIARRPVVQAQSLDLNQLITDLTEELHELAGEHMDLEVRLAPELKPVSSVTGAMEQMLMDLGTHVRDAMPAGGTLIISTEDADVDEAHCGVHPEAKPGAYARLTVSYTGEGVSGISTERIFEPFSDAEEMGALAGFGLSVVYGMVKQHGGWIEVDDAGGQGVAFGIYLPVWGEEREKGKRKRGRRKT